MHYCSNLCNQPVNEGSDILYCSILLLMRLTLPLRYRIRGGLLPRLFTLTVLPAVYFLLCCLSFTLYNENARPLAGIISEGVRTFLCKTQRLPTLSTSLIITIIIRCIVFDRIIQISKAPHIGFIKHHILR